MISWKPIIVITMGDAAGVGPEVIVKALAGDEIYGICRPLVVGDSTILEETIKTLGKSLRLHPVESIGNIQGQPGAIDVMDLHNLDRKDVVTGQVCASCGRAAMEYIEKAARMSLEKAVDAMVTAPINKEATRQAGYGEVGHLEYLAKLTGVTEYATMLMTGRLRVVHLTTHYSLREACDQVKKERIFARIKLTYKSFRGWGIDHPRIAVAALNPHGGEGGMFGREEIEEILPAVQQARQAGIDATGPAPADSVFHRALNGEFDVVLAMYHDQGHIPVKVHGFEESISVALGLPFIRTSVDHGTAFDIAGKGIADSRSMTAAIRVAVKLATGSGLEY
jgi:4-hydroxythreonine-4-phosphate dehydrogenase